jgi:hypothetical protein
MAVINKDDVDNNDDTSQWPRPRFVKQLHAVISPVNIFAVVYDVSLRYANCELAGGSLLFRYAQRQMRSGTRMSGPWMECRIGVLSLTPQPPPTHPPAINSSSNT